MQVVSVCTQRLNQARRLGKNRFVSDLQGFASIFSASGSFIARQWFPNREQPPIFCKCVAVPLDLRPLRLGIVYH